MKGVIVLVMVWAGLVAWTAKVAQARGRAPIVWGLLGGLIGIACFGVGMAIFDRATDLDVGTGVMILTLLLPLFLMVAGMTAVVIALHRAPIYVAALKTWPVHFVDRGEGNVRFAGAGKVVFDWRDGSREAAIPEVRAQADGECVRVTIANVDELCFMPMGKPETPAGRRQQSVLLAGMFGR